jgi:hypothetical protein
MFDRTTNTVWLLPLVGAQKKLHKIVHYFFLDLELYIFIWYYFQQKAYSKGLEDAGISDPQALDKNYWIQRVGEVIILICLKNEKKNGMPLFRP